MKRLRIGPTVMAITIFAAASAGAQAEPRTISVTRDARVLIENTSGPTIVVGWDRNEVEVSAAGAQREDVEIRGGGRRVDISAPGYARLTVRVPAGATVDVRAISGPVTVRGVTNAIDVEAASGAVTIEGVARSINVEAFSGAVLLRGGGTEVTRVEAASGSVRATEVGGVVDLSSSSGSVSAAGSVRDAKLFAVSGTASFNGTVAPGGRLTLESSSGNVLLRLPANTSATYELSTVNGTIRNAFGPRPESSTHGSGATLRFSVAGGSARIKAATVSGSVELRER